MAAGVDVGASEADWEPDASADSERERDATGETERVEAKRKEITGSRLMIVLMKRLRIEKRKKQ